MKLMVKLHGTLRQHFPDYQPSQGIEVEIPQGATVKDLLKCLNIADSHRPVIIVNGLVLKEEDQIPDGTAVDVFQSLQGG